MDLDSINLVSSEDSPDLVMSGGLLPLDIKVSCNTNGDKTRENIKVNVQRGFAEIIPLEQNTRHLVIVGGGPSLKTNWKEIIWWAQAQGADVMALNGAAKFLNAQGFVPTFQLVIDPRDNRHLIGEAGDYLIASQVDPVTLDNLPPDRTALLHLVGSCMTEGEDANGKQVVSSIVNGTLIGGDVTAGLVALCTAHTLGYRDMHLYGYDSSYADDEHHAYPQEQTDQEQKRLEVFARDGDGVMQKFTTNFAMAKQAELFPKTAELLCNAGSQMTVHGTGLLPTIAHSMRKQ